MIKLGSTSISTIKLGLTKVRKVLLGSTKVWATYDQEVLDDGPSAYWRLGGNTNDETGNYNGTAVGSPSYVAGAMEDNTAVILNGSSQYITGTTIGNLGSSLAGGMTIEAWVKKTNAANHDCIAGVVNTGTSTYFEVIHNSAADGSVLADSMRLVIRGNDGLVRFGAAGSVGLNDGAWHHVMAILTPSALALYIDGISKAITYASTGTPSTFTNFGFAVGIGARNLRGTFDSHFAGTLDEVAIYSGDKSARALDHYNARNG